MAAFGLTIVSLESDVAVAPTAVGAVPIVAGRGVTSDGEYPDATDAEGKDLLGVSLTAGPTLKRIYVIASGTINVSNTLVAGRTLILRSDAGEFDYEENLASGERYQVLGRTVGVNSLLVKVDNTLFRKP